MTGQPLVLLPILCERQGDQDNKRNTKLADLFVNNRTNDFWREVTRTNYPNSLASSTIDNNTTPESIANAFKDQYAAILRSDFFAAESVNEFCKSLDRSCANCNIDNSFNINDVFTACHQLKRGKKDSDCELISDAIINVPLVFFNCLCILNNVIISHGYVPTEWKSGTIFPLLKAATLDKTTIASYRPITLSSLFGKMFDLIELNRYFDAFYFSDLQFGFKRLHSANHCTFVAKEVISYYINSGSNVYACALDTQKAFDRVDLVKLFRKLLQRPISALIVRILFHLYFNIKLRILWNNVYASEFLSLNGVKQGGILSPYLFSTFINDLILELENRQGCFIGHMFYGCIVYTDDILLLAPSLRALRHMLNICSIFADDNNIRFNQAKSHCLHFCKFNTAIKQYPVKLPGTALTWTDHIAHLGHILCSSLDDSMDIDKRKRDFCSQENYFFAHIHHLSPALKSGLFQTYCQSFYGSQIWNLQNAAIESFNVAMA